MAKMKKKYVNVGAPLYMSQFTMIMLILIVMCMIMSVMTPKQEAGFLEGEEGFGKKKNPNALGIVINAGQFKFGNFGKSRTYAPNPGSKETDDTQNPHIKTMTGEGGGGNTDSEVKSRDKQSVAARLTTQFPEKTADITGELFQDIEKISMGLNLFSFNLQVKIYTADFDSQRDNFQLGWQRAEKIIQLLTRQNRIERSKIKVLVYTDKKYIEQADFRNKDSRQEVFFYLNPDTPVKERAL